MQSWEYIEYTEPEPTSETTSTTGDETKASYPSDYIANHDCAAVAPQKRMSCGVTVFAIVTSAAVLVVSFLL